MALFLRRDDNRSELQTRVAAQLEDRLKTKQQEEVQYEKPEPAMLEQQETMNPVKIVITIAVILFVVLIFWLLRP
jgi:type VI protein secretion system component VasF